MKTTLAFSFLFVALNGFSQKKQNVYFFKDFYHVASIDSATFVRIVSEPDSGSKLYNVTDYYKNGKRKLIGKSSTIDPQKFQGQLATFYENGKRASVVEYEDDNPIGDEYDYFSTARLALVKTHYKEKRKDGSFDDRFLLTASYDSLGNQQVIDGNGYFKGYDYDHRTSFKADSITEEGNVKNGKREGEWKGTIRHGTFSEVYNNNVLISGTLTDKDGTKYSYSERVVWPQFPDGLDAFNRFLTQTIRYPNYERDHNITGKVYVHFIVEKDGTLSHVIATTAISEGLDRMSTYGVRLSPPWMPGTAFGKLERMSFVVPVSFTLTDAK